MRISFAADMLRQAIMALKTLHSQSYSHGDLKPENVCVRESSGGGLKFSLIDFGLCKKLPVPGNNRKKNSNFRGNLMFCSDLQLKHFIPTLYCDLTSLVAVAFYVVEKEVPSTIYASECMKKNPEIDLFSQKEFKYFRQIYQRRFEKDFCSKMNPFHKLYSYIRNKRDFEELRERKFIKAKEEGKVFQAAQIDYEHLVTLIPDEYGLKGDLNFIKPTR